MRFDLDVALARRAGFRLGLAWSGETDALFLEDLGDTISGTDHVHRLLAERREADLRVFEEELVEMPV